MADIRKHHDGVHLDHSSVTTPAADKTINNIQALYENLANHFGPRCDPDAWWPICANRLALNHASELSTKSSRCRSSLRRGRSSSS
jgi:hypothetical protein